MMGNILIKSAIFDLGIQWSLFAVAAFFQTEIFYDLAGSGTFALLAVKSLQWSKSFFKRKKIQTGIVLAWAVRLGLYLFSRILKDGNDRRFDKVRGNPRVFFIYWTVQALWVFITLLPTLIQNTKQKDVPIGRREKIGWTLAILGFLVETLGDYQKSQFRANPDNAGRFITTGLWSLSRHPNYLGEILVWLGLYLSSLSTLEGVEHLSVVSPLFVTYLLTSVSGIPLLEQSASRRWGQEVAYQNYVRSTALLVPFLY